MPDRTRLATILAALCLLAPAARAQSAAEDVAALASGPGAKAAAARLVERGPEALPALHAALLASDTEPRRIASIMQVLAAIGDASSVAPIVELAEGYPERWILKPAFLALTALPQTEASAAFAARIADNPSEAWSVRQGVLAYFGMHRDPRGRRWAEPLVDARDPVRRAAALFVLARLGDREALGPILELLEDGAPPSARVALLMGLAELVDAEDFAYRAPAELSWTREYKSALRYAQYRTAEGALRADACRAMLRAATPGHSELGVRCLLELGREEDLLPYIALDLADPQRPAMLKADIRKAGYRVVDTGDGISIEPARPTAASADAR